MDPVMNPPYIIIDFKDRYIKPTHYTLKQNASSLCSMNHWILQARKGNNSEWITLSEHNYNYPSGPGNNSIDSYALNASDFYNHFKILVAGPNCGDWTVSFCGFE
eukprot:398599_1